MKMTASTGPETDRSIWYHRHGPVLAIGMWSERDPGHGEDAEPLLVHHTRSGEGVLGVFDGLGGAGAAIAYEPPCGVPRTGAWVGARVARAAVESWFRDGLAGSGRRTTGTLHRRLTELLDRMRPVKGSRLMAKMRRELPTTMAVLSYALTGQMVRCHALWAGDSRAYVLTADAGLQALTRDHTVETDALDQLRQDPPMANVISADRPFTVDSFETELPAPCVLICATDGFFGYVDTPADFECLLLDALRRSRDEADWAQRLCDWAGAASGDDASLSGVALGFRGFEELQTFFSARTDDVVARYRPTLRYDGLTLEQWRTRTWHTYRPGYERRMPPLRREAL
ncbi:PP2C family protein-serine/threonine phosphatase [Actinomadura scrupuli]|uniref:PP2C family protein-serine/threonine phosphatase n=1 Tax=Actinomadura scrupuli TaxID=559629 RepID=UPI003D99C017